MAEAVMSVVTLKYGSHRSWQKKNYFNFILFHFLSLCCEIPVSHLCLLVLKHFMNAGIEGGAREHGGDGIGQVQDCFKN